ncbi:hypothetical protein ACH9L7_00695 [Haloferax sp. S1W]|uniref:hypothetical protein n=1 Tax=Haloferax sp. S1W TaxID=3377110 RepID=UPI0037C97670
MTHKTSEKHTQTPLRYVRRWLTAGLGRSRSNLRTDDRAASAIVGTILAFALVVSVIAMVQVSAVPAWNQQTEFQHLETVEGEFLTVDERISAASSGTSSRATIQAGVDYPTRALFVSPSAGSGTIQTSNVTQATISNAEAVGSGRDYWNGSTHAFDSQLLLYQPDYQYLQSDPVLTHEGSARYTKYGANESGATQSLVDGTRISLVLLEGDLNYGAKDATTFSVVPLSAGTDYITVTNDADPIQISLATRLSNETWTELLASEPNAYVASYSSGPEFNTVVVELVPGKTYDLHIARVGIDTPGSMQEPKYIVPVSGDGATLPPGAKHLAVVEVRDAQNNPVVGATVETPTGSTAAGGLVAARDTGTLSTVTDENGRATFVYTAPSDPDRIASDSFDILVKNATGAEVDRTTFDVETRYGGLPLPTRGFVAAVGDPGHAYADKNRNGQFDGSDTRVNATYQGKTLVYDAGNERLVVPPSVGTLVHDDDIELKGDGVSLHVDAISTGGDILVDGDKHSVKAIGVSLTSPSGSVTVSAGEAVDFSGGSFGATGDITVTGDNGIDLDNAALTNEKGGSNADILVQSSSGNISARSADLSSKAGITIDGYGSVDLAEAGTSTTQGGDVTITSQTAGAGLGGLVVLADGGFEVTTVGNIDLRGASVTTVGTDSKRNIVITSDKGGLTGEEAALVTENDIDLTAPSVEMQRSTLDAGDGDTITITYNTNLDLTDASIDGNLVINQGGA